VTTHAPLRSRRTKAESVCHVRVLGDGDSPTSPIKIQGCSDAFYVNLVTIPRAKWLRKLGVLAPPQLAAGAAVVRVWLGL
jgi:hypothetical protein